MRPIIEGPPAANDAKQPLGKRLMWFAAIWLASLISVAAVAYALRVLIIPARP
jgi:hypothetical protein